MNPIARFFIFFFLFDLVFFINLPEPKCPKSFNCGFLGHLEFPFPNEPDCDMFLVDCTSLPPEILFEPGGVWYSVLPKISTNRFRVRDEVLYDHLMANESCLAVGNSSIPHSPFSSFTIFPKLTIFSCSNFLGSSHTEQIQDYFKNYTSYGLCDNITLYYRDDNKFLNRESGIPESCSIVQMPVNPVQDPDDFFRRLTPEFDVEWNVSADCLSCYNRGRKCVTDSKNRIRCEGKRIIKKKIFLIGGVSLTALLSISILFFLLNRRKYKLLKFLSLQAEHQKDVELFLENHGNLGQKRFNYSDLKKMTNSFSKSLGKGGYGSVYKGRLPDGRLVAVKILNELKGNREDFINEVATISRTSHINIVTLLGFCCEGSKRALVYNFMPNGSLDKFMQKTAEWQILFEIAVGIARGL